MISSGGSSEATENSSPFQKREFRLPWYTISAQFKLFSRFSQLYKKEFAIFDDYWDIEDTF